MLLGRAGTLRAGTLHELYVAMELHIHESIAYLATIARLTLHVSIKPVKTGLFEQRSEALAAIVSERGRAPCLASRTSIQADHARYLKPCLKLTTVYMCT